MIVSQKSKIEKPDKILVVLVLWGKQFWNTFMELGLKSRLCKTNLPTLSKNYNLTYRIYGVRHEYLENKVNLHKQFGEHSIDLEFFELDEKKIDNNKYHLFTTIQKQILAESTWAKTAFIFDFPDHFYINGFFKQFIPMIESGKRLILVPGIRLSLEKFAKNEIIQKKILADCDFDNQTLLKQIHQCLHKNMTEDYFLHNKIIPSWTSFYYRKLNKSDFLMHGFHYHPFYIWPENNSSLDCQTIDQGEYIYNACPRARARSICTRPEFTYFELSSDSYGANLPKIRHSLIHTLYWAHAFVHPKQKKLFFKKKIYSNEKIKFFSKQKILCNFFSIAFLSLCYVPTKILKPLFFHHHQKVIGKKIPYLKFIKKIHLLNYFESLLNNHFSYFTIDEIIRYVKRNRKNLCNEVLRKILAEKLISLEGENQLLSFYTIVNEYKSEKLLREVCSEIIKKKNQTLTNFILEKKFYLNFSPKQKKRFFKDYNLSNSI